MKRFYLSGQNNFGNRGCEALVRSTAALLKEEFGEIEVMVPSYRPDLDARQWPDANQHGCRFVRADPFPFTFRLWSRARKLLPFLKYCFLPDYVLAKDIQNDLAACDALIVIGGDNLTLDYGIESLIWHTRFAQKAQNMGKTVMVWGASIGSFSSEPAIEQFVSKFLRNTHYITIRETISQQYLTKLGIEKNVSLVADGAFILTPQAFATDDFWPKHSEAGVLGFNISPLIQKFRSINEPRHVLQQEVATFLKEELESSDISILLIPHVDPLDRHTKNLENSDSQYMREILSMIGDYDDRIRIAPNHLNAAQLKYVLSQCTYFIGARTHATIAALSSYVPTIFIAYSIKAKGLNFDLFGHKEFVLETPMVSKASLKNYYNLLVKNQNQIITKLHQRIPELRQKSLLSAKKLNQVLSLTSMSLLKKC